MRKLEYAENGLCQKIPENIEGIVFLDIDGVLNQIGKKGISILKVKADILAQLNRFVEDNNIYIVLISDHAYDLKNKEYNELVFKNIFNLNRLLGRLPRETNIRGLNIESFQKREEINGIPFIVIDDNNIGGPEEITNQHIQTDPKIGLSEDDLIEAEKKLKEMIRKALEGIPQNIFEARGEKVT